MLRELHQVLVAKLETAALDYSRLSAARLPTMQVEEGEVTTPAERQLVARGEMVVAEMAEPEETLRRGPQILAGAEAEQTTEQTDQPEALGL